MRTRRKGGGIQTVVGRAHLTVLACGAGVPLVERIGKLRSGIGAAPSALVEHIPNVRDRHVAVLAGVDAPAQAVGGIGVGIEVVDLLHELVVDAQRVVGILADTVA